MLAGCKPFDQSGSYSPLLSLIEAMALERSRTAPSLRRNRHDVPWSIESIARMCLAADPSQRYQQAEHLAEDLRCFLEDRPLKHAPELSRVERVRKWMRRHPRMSSSASVATVATLLLIGAGITLFGVREHLASTQQELQVVQAQERKRAYEEGTTRARYLVNTVTAMPDHLQQGLAACEKTLALYDILDRDNWQENTNWQLLAPDERQRLGEDARELLLLLAWARVQQAPDQPGVLRESLRLLDRPAAIQGLAASRALWEDRALYLDQLGDAMGAQAARASAAEIQPANARDHYLLATTYARSKCYAKAIGQLDQALRLNPYDFWSTIQKGICHQELHQYTLATAAFSAGIGLWPEFAWGYFNRGYALDQSGHKAEAQNDYTAALERDPGLVVAYLNRGMLRLELKQFAEALADFQKAAELGRDDASLHASVGAALEGLGKHADADQAFQTAFDRAGPADGEASARIRLVYGFAVAARLPRRAEEVFEEVLQQIPLGPQPVGARTILSQALYGRALLLVESGQQAEAVRFFGRALDATPGFVEARRFRAVLRARIGQFEAACQDINWCLEWEPEAGASLYAAACVSALAAEKLAGPAAKAMADQATAFLNKAFAHSYGRDKAETDPDLKGIRELPEFQRLVRKALD
jgi:tetratricopeptide (TPR) repeat protein